jgi:tripartite-type tricarboxylate transporter receptor subunit TctC
MFHSVRQITLWSFVSLLALSLIDPRVAYAYPDQPIKIIVTFPPGGSADIVIRKLQPAIADELHQPVVIENRSGAGGNIGIGAVAQAAPDGYTLGVAAAGVLTVNPHLNRAAMSFDPLKDLAPISLLAQIPFVLVASQESKLASVNDVVAAARAHPDELSIGHGGNGTAMHLTAQLFNHVARLDLTLVPYRGSGPVTQDIVAGHIPLGITDIPSSVSQIQARQIKLLGITSRKRFPSVPEVPTFAESGLPDYESIGWFGFVAPAGTPAKAIATLNAAIVAALEDPEVRDHFHAMGAEPMPGSPAEFGKFIRGEYEKWAGVVAQSGARQR